jgi:hypothetical protein
MSPAYFDLRRPAPEAVPDEQLRKRIKDLADRSQPPADGWQSLLKAVQETGGGRTGKTGLPADQPHK